MVSQEFPLSAAATATHKALHDRTIPLAKHSNHSRERIENIRRDFKELNEKYYANPSDYGSRLTSQGGNEGIIRLVISSFSSQSSNTVGQKHTATSRVFQEICSDFRHRYFRPGTFESTGAEDFAPHLRVWPGPVTSVLQCAYKNP